MKRHEQLGAVVVELCPARWARHLEIAISQGTLAKRSENVLAACIAMQHGVPVLLGDTEDDDFYELSKQRAIQYFLDMFNPFGGWQALSDDFSRCMQDLDTSDVAQSELLLEGEAPICARDFAEPEWVLGCLQAVMRTVSGIPRIAWVPFLIAFAIVATNQVPTDVPHDLTAARLATLAAVLINVPLLRLLLVPFLEERNEELAKSIRRAAAQHDAPVVAILGAAHVNGVARLLVTEHMRDISSYDGAGRWLEEGPPAQLMDTLHTFWSSLFPVTRKPLCHAS
mmetsp:Transcript_5279/g.10096  ORF Transcript_5279/g.10096 Transcript_5279/m.10096 type:complete len:283 (-) Transcript_5279:19-867(-)